MNDDKRQIEILAAEKGLGFLSEAQESVYFLPQLLFRSVGRATIERTAAYFPLLCRASRLAWILDPYKHLKELWVLEYILLIVRVRSERLRFQLTGKLETHCC